MVEWGYTIRQVAEMTGLQYFEVWDLYQQGWTIEKVFEKHPVIEEQEHFNETTHTRQSLFGLRRV